MPFSSLVCLLLTHIHTPRRWYSNTNSSQKQSEQFSMVIIIKFYVLISLCVFFSSVIYFLYLSYMFTSRIGQWLKSSKNSEAFFFYIYFFAERNILVKLPDFIWLPRRKWELLFLWRAKKCFQPSSLEKWHTWRDYLCH